MANQDPLSRDVQLPGQDAEFSDLDPAIAPEPEESAEGSDQAQAEVASEMADRQLTAESSPEVGNTLIQPENS